MWDVTVVDTLAHSYLATSPLSEGAAVELAAARTMVKYAELSVTRLFYPLTVESL